MFDQIPSLTQEAITPWFNKLALISECVAQVQKDLGSYGIEITYRGIAEDAYDELFEQLQPQLESLFHRNTSLSEILYRIDVDEDKVHTIMESEEEFSHSLTRLILWRELQKVVTRFLMKQATQ